MTNEIAEEVAETSTTPKGAQPETPVQEQAVEPDAKSPDTTSPSDDADPDSEGRKSRARERIEQLNAEKKALQEAAEYWRSLATKTPETTPAPPKDDPRPTPDQFDYDQDKWAAALTDWADRQIARRAEEAVSKTITRQRTEAEQEAQQKGWKEAAAKFAETHPDFDAVVTNPALRITNDMAEVIRLSEKGPDLAYHLGKNPDKAARIAQMNPRAQAMALGRLEAEISRPAPKPQPTKAPAPPNPIGSEATPSVDPSKMSIDDWMKWRSKELRSKRS